MNIYTLGLPAVYMIKLWLNFYSTDLWDNTIEHFLNDHLKRNATYTPKLAHKVQSVFVGS